MGNSRTRTVRYPSLTAWIAVAYIAVALCVPGQPLSALALALPGVWLLAVALLRPDVRVAAATRPPTSIPLTSTGEIGRFNLRSLGDGRRVEVCLGGVVVAQAIATDAGDQLVVDFEAPDDSEVEHFGSAIWRAISMVTIADEARRAFFESAAPGDSLHPLM